MAKAAATPEPLVINDHVIEIVETGEEWDKANELYCRLHQARCTGCGLVGKSARTVKTAIKHFERDAHYRGVCPAVTRQLSMDFTGGEPC